MGQSSQDDTGTELSRPEKPGLAEEGIQHLIRALR